MTVTEAEYRLFNLEVLLAMDRLRFSSEARELIELGMHLEDWAAHDPKHIGEAFNQVNGLVDVLIERHQVGPTKASDSRTPSMDSAT